MLRLRIRTQLILFLILQVSVLLALAGFYLQWQLRRQIELELARRMIALAQAASHVTTRAVGGAAVVSLLPGDEPSRTGKALHTWLGPLLEAGQLSRVVIFDAHRRIYFDSSRELPIGSEYVRLRFDAQEINSAWQDRAAAAKLFVDVAGLPFKAAYAPLRDQSGVVAVVGVEGSAASLAAVAETRQVLWSIAALGLIAATLSGIFFARRLTEPLERLRRAAAAIGAGAEEVTLELKGTEEIRFLAGTMAQMRNAIRRREQSLRLMLAGVAHEIRNPLGGIELFAGLLEQDAPPQLKPQVQKIRDEVRRLENLVRDFLDYARPRESRHEPVFVRSLLQEIREQQAHLGPQVAWVVDVPEQLTVQADPEQLRRMLTNLVRNALEAMSGAGEIRVTAHQHGGRVTLAIADTGPGVPRDTADRIFEPFFTTRAQGSGLGLALVRRLAEQNHGSIKLAPGSDQNGAQFLLDLPAGRP